MSDNQFFIYVEPGRANEAGAILKESDPTDSNYSLASRFSDNALYAHTNLSKELIEQRLTNAGIKAFVVPDIIKIRQELHDRGSFSLIVPKTKQEAAVQAISKFLTDWEVPGFWKVEKGGATGVIVSGYQGKARDILQVLEKVTGIDNNHVALFHNHQTPDYNHYVALQNEALEVNSILETKACWTKC